MATNKKLGIIRAWLGISLILVLCAAFFVAEDIARQKLFAARGKLANGELAIEYPELNDSCSQFSLEATPEHLSSTCSTMLDNVEGNLTIELNVYSLLMDAETTSIDIYQLNAKGIEKVYTNLLEEEGTFEINLAGLEGGDTLILEIIEKFSGKKLYRKAAIVTALDIVAHETD